MKLRQVALAAQHLEPARSQLFELLGVSADFADPGVGEFGLVNSVMAIGNSFLEIVAPDQPDTAAGRLLARRGDTCGYMVLMQVEDFAEFDAHLDAHHVRKVWQVNRRDVSACHVHPKDIGGAIVSFDEMRPREDWVWGGPNWTEQRAQHATRILGCTLCSPNHEGLAVRWSEVMDTPLIAAGSNRCMEFADGTFIEFIAGDDYEGICSITFGAEDAQALYHRAADMGLSSAPDGQQVALGGLALHFKNDA